MSLASPLEFNEVDGVISCRFRQPSTDARDASCSFAAQYFDGNADLVRVSETTCLACQDFFEPRPSDPNPVVASLIHRASVQTNGTVSELTRWATVNLRRGTPNDPVSEKNGLERDRLSLPSCHRNNHDAANIHDPPCLCFVRQANAAVGIGSHISGWPYALSSLMPLACKHGVLFDDFVEQRFCYELGAPGYQEPWIGIFHHPPEDFELAGYRNSLKGMFESRFWRESEPHLLGGITLSEHLATFLRDTLDRAFISVAHPAGDRPVRWSPKWFIANRNKKILQIGWFLRNTWAIHQLGSISGFTRCRLQHKIPQMDWYNNRIESFLERNGRSVDRSEDVVEAGFVSENEYHRLLCQNVVFCELIAASANNVVIDCIAHHTPLIVNRHPAAEEYLGTDYPLFYDDLSQAKKLFETNQIIAAHEHLCRLDALRDRGSEFRRKVAGAVQRILSSD